MVYESLSALFQKHIRLANPILNISDIIILLHVPHVPAHQVPLFVWHKFVLSSHHGLGGVRVQKVGKINNPVFTISCM